MHGLRAAWRLFDADGNGSTTIGELRDGLARLQAAVADPEARRTHGARVSEREMVAMMRLADADCSGELGFEEFVHAMTRCAPPGSV